MAGERVAYAYIPFASDNVYEDMGDGVILLKGPEEKVVAAHALILAAISKDDEEANEKQVLRCMLAQTDGFDEEATFGQDNPPVCERPLFQALKALGAGLNWSTFQSLEDIDDDTYLSVTTEIIYLFYHTGGLAYAMQ